MANHKYSNDIAEQYGRVRNLVRNADIQKTIVDLNNAKENKDLELENNCQEKLKNLLNGFYKTELENKNSIVERWPIDYGKAFKRKPSNLIIPIGMTDEEKTALLEKMQYNEKLHLKVVSPNEIQKDLYEIYHEEFPKNSEFVLKKMDNKTIDLLKKGYDVFYDATNLDRESIFEKVSNNVPGTVVKVACVSTTNMDEKLKEHPPTKNEGFDLVYSTNDFSEKIRDISKLNYEHQEMLEYAYWDLSSKDNRDYKYAMEDLKDIDWQFKTLQNSDDEMEIKTKCIKELKKEDSSIIEKNPIESFEMDEYLKESQSQTESKHLKM